MELIHKHLPLAAGARGSLTHSSSTHHCNEIFHHATYYNITQWKVSNIRVTIIAALESKLNQTTFFHHQLKLCFVGPITCDKAKPCHSFPRCLHCERQYSSIKENGLQNEITWNPVVQARLGCKIVYPDNLSSQKTNLLTLPSPHVVYSNAPDLALVEPDTVW